jgi:nicotinamide-nucleotide amidase
MTCVVVNLPNTLTISRLVSIPVVMVLLAVAFPYHDQLAAAVFLLASFTDVADGNLARWRGEVTELGKFLDPLADKLFVLSVLIMLVQEGLLAAWVVVVIFGRELLITVLRSFRVGRGVVAATPFGKTKTVVQSVAVLLLILQRPYPALSPAATVMVGAAVLFTVASGIDYLWRFRKVWWGPEPESRPPAAGATALSPAASGPGPDPLVGQIAERLGTAGLTLAVAESCTGGLLAGALTDLPGSSAWFVGGIVAYSNQVKHEQLGVPHDLLDRYGAVSAEVAQAMAGGVRRALGADLAVSVTGIAGPDAAGTDKPVGLTHIWLDGLGRSEGRRFVFGGDRWENRRRAVREALAMVLEQASMLDRANRHS